MTAAPPAPTDTVSLKPLGIVLTVTGALAIAAWHLGLSLPVLQWFFSFAPAADGSPPEGWRAVQQSVLGHSLSALAILAGLYFLFIAPSWKPNPMTRRRWQRFRSFRRGWWSFLILMGLILISLLDQALVGKRALFVSYQGKWSFPAFIQAQKTDQDYGGDSAAEPNYRELKERLKREKAGFVLLPLVPWAPTYDADDTQSAEVIQKDGLWHKRGSSTPYSGRAVRYYAFEPGTPEAERTIHSQYRFRRGKLDGEVVGYGTDQSRQLVEVWKQGQKTTTETAPDPALFQDSAGGAMTIVVYPPAPPSLSDRHFLGTRSNGWDVAAQIFGGLQVILKAALIYLGITYFLGILLGCATGYFGGWFDIIFQRLLEIFSSIPFLLLIIVIVNGLGRDKSGLMVVLLIICAFSWMGVASYMRTAAFREKSRDYIAAARLTGLSTFRIIFRHLAPNALSTIVTLIPFSVVSIATSITALDFIGFGLPDRYPSWGRTLADGLNNLDAPWIVASVSGAMFAILLIFTFIGEAVREAFDPKKFTTYQ